MVETLNSWRFEWNQSSKHEATPYKPYKPIEYREDMDAENILTQLEENNENEPEITQVRNRPCVVWAKAWIYEGSRISWGDHDNPCWKWRFVWNDWKCIFEWTWDYNGLFMAGNVIANWKTFNITYSYINDKTKLPILYWTGNVDWKEYSCRLDEYLELSSITYAWVTLKLEHERWKTYLENKEWERLLLPYLRKSIRSSRVEGNPDEDFVAVKIAECISIVKNSWKEFDKFARGKRENILAHYKNPSHYDALTEKYAYSGFWIPVYLIVDWLNASRNDFWI